MDTLSVIDQRHDESVRDKQVGLSDMKCRLCLKDKKLLKSHIIPEFFYKPVYDDLHRLNLVSAETPNRIKYEQKGYREKLLCNDCEGLLSTFEDYVRRVFYGGVEVETKMLKNGILIRNIDYKKFKLFQLSLLWRASVSRQGFFSEVNLGTKEETIRKMLNAQNPGEPHQFGCIMAILLWEENKPLDGIILPPLRLHIEGHICFRFIVGGYTWLFVVSRHSNDFMLKDYFLRPGKELTIPFARRDQYADLFKGFDNIKAQKATPNLV